jgi:hypothetical protein
MLLVGLRQEVVSLLRFGAQQEAFRKIIEGVLFFRVGEVILECIEEGEEMAGPVGKNPVGDGDVKRRHTFRVDGLVCQEDVIDDWGEQGFEVSGLERMEAEIRWRAGAQNIVPKRRCLVDRVEREQRKDGV